MGGGGVMLRDHIKVLLFLTSYIPLYAIVAIKNFEDYRVLSVGLVILSTTLTILVAVVMYRVYQVGGRRREIIKVEDANRLNLEYFIAYVIPFIPDNLVKLDNAISFLIVLFIMGVIYIKSDLIYMNPPLVLVGFNVFKAQARIDEKIKDVVIITRKKKRELTNNEELIELGDNVVLGKTRKWIST